MKTFDKYGICEFLKAFFISLFILLFIYIIVNVFENISLYVDNKVPLFVILEYYFFQSPYIICSILSPIVCLLGVFLSFGKFSRNFELPAMFFSGVSFYRIFSPILFLGLILSIIILIVSETFVPYANERSIKLKKEKISKIHSELAPSENIYYTSEEGTLYHIKFIAPAKGIIKGLTIYKLSNKYKVKERIDADMAIYSESWKLISGSISTFTSSSIKVAYFDTLILNLKEKPKDFVKPIKEPTVMGFFEFKSYIEKLKRIGKDTTEELCDLYFRITFPFMNLIVILLGFPLSVRIRTIGFILGFAIALFVSFIYWGVTQLSKALGRVGTITPLFASLLSLILFLFLGLILLWKLRK